MRVGKDEGRRAYLAMQAQIALLRSGTRATDYAAREVLGLSLGCTVDDIAAALHRCLHKFGKAEGDEVSHAVLLGYVTAAQCLLRGLVGK